MPPAIASIRNALERDAKRLAAHELQRRAAWLAALPPEQRRTITAVAESTAQGVGALLVAEARSERRLAAALGSIYGPGPDT
jgi:hypothetical protein